MAIPIQSRHRLRVQNKLGLHATPAALIVKILNKYNEIDVWVRNVDDQVNGKSIMGLMMLAANRNTNLLFIIDGGSISSQKSLIEELENLFNNKFYED